MFNFKGTQNQKLIMDYLIQLSNKIDSNHAQLIKKIESIQFQVRRLKPMKQYQLVNQNQKEINAQQLQNQKIQYHNNHSHQIVQPKLQQINQIPYKPFLNGSQILTQALQNNMKLYFEKQCMYISSSNLIFNSNSKKPLSHQIFDNIANLLLLIKIKPQCKILGGFTALSFKKRVIPQENQKCFIFDLTNNKFFKPKNNFKTICYDPNYIIFGNSQIRIKFGQNMLYSSFGVLKSLFHHEDYDAKRFLGINNNIINEEVDIQFIQMYQLQIITISK